MNDWDEEPAELAQPERWDDAKPVPIQRVPVSLNGTADPESYVIGCCILDEGATLDKALTAGLKWTDFISPGKGLAFAVLGDLRSRGTPIALDTLVEGLGSRLDQAGGIGELMIISDPLTIGTTARADHYINRLLQDSANRRTVNQARLLIERAEKGEDVASIGPAKKPDDPERLNKKRVRLTAKPPEPVTRLFLAGKPIATPGNLVTLISRAKTGKTAAIGAAIAAIIGAHHDRSDLDTFGFTAPHNREAVILIDTEQSPYDAFTCHERALKRAGDAQDPDWLCHYALVGESAEQLCKDLIEVITRAKATHGGIFTIIIDGIADFVDSVNDESECNNFISWLRSIAVEYNCPIICVIHSNEATKSGDDGRGHLGKQLTRKAESNLLLKKDGDVTTITSEKQRKAPITEQDGIAFRWSDELGRHVSCEFAQSKDEKKAGRKQLYSLSKFREFFPAHNEKHGAVMALWNKCKSITDIKRTTFRDLCEREYACGELDRIIDKNLGPCYRLMLGPGQ